ncbi:MAG: hypothetical protein GTO08_08570 [Deltaproteobacteria bacterium]|nr:hypothetical protein [Deltaproteobacteria bacterium]
MKKALLYIAGGIAVFALLFYLFFFLTLSGESVTGEINRVVEKAGYEFRAESVKKELPLTLIFEGVTITGPGNTDVLNFPEVVFQFKISKFFGQWPIRLSLRDRQNNDIDAGLSRGLNSLTLSGTDFIFSPEMRRKLPSFIARKLDFHIERIVSDEAGGISLSGKGTFSFDTLLVKGQYGMDVEISGLAGKAIFKGSSIYFKNCTATVLSSNFIFSGTVSDYMKGSKGTVDIEARGRDISPLLSNLLKIKPENEYNVEIRIRGRLASPDIEVVNR